MVGNFLLVFPISIKTRITVRTTTGYYNNNSRKIRVTKLKITMYSGLMIVGKQGRQTH
jgi:hypothetical protein